MRLHLFFVTFILTFLACSSALAAPNLQVDDPAFDFGEVFQGEKVLYTFDFTNEGDENLEIERVRSSCGCTAVLVSEKIIPPGGKGEVKANFDSTRFRDAVSKTIYLYSNDPVHPVMQLHIKGKVLESVVVEPKQVHFGSVPPEGSFDTTVLLRNMSKKSLMLGKAHTTAAELVVKMPEKTFASGDEVILELQFTPKPDQVRFSGYVLVPVEGLPTNELRIPVYASIKN